MKAQFVLLSVFLHIFAAAVFIYSPLPKDASQAKPEMVEIEIRPRAVAAGSRSQRSNNNKTTLKSLVPQFSQLRSAAVGSLGEDAGSGVEDLALGWGDGGADLGKVADSLFYERIRERVEGLFYYPGVLARRNISGLVKSRLVVNGESGQCDFARTKLEGAHVFLQVYTMSLLRKLCSYDFKQNLPARRWVVVDMAFDFEISERPVDELKFKNFSVGNVLAFHRGVQKSVAEWQLGPLKGIWFIPAIGVDFGWLGDKWDQWVKGRDIYEEFKKGS